MTRPSESMEPLPGCAVGGGVVLRHERGWAVAKETQACAEPRPVIGQWQR